MLDKVLEIDPKQEKALVRKANCYVETAEYQSAEKIIKVLEDIAF